MQSRPNKKMDLAGAQAAGRVQSAVGFFCRNQYRGSLHTLCTAGADACGEGEEQEIDQARFSSRSGRIRDEYAHAASISELLDGSVTWSSGTTHTDSALANTHRYPPHSRAIVLPESAPRGSLALREIDRDAGHAGVLIERPRSGGKLAERG